MNSMVRLEGAIDGCQRLQGSLGCGRGMRRMPVSHRLYNLWLWPKRIVTLPSVSRSVLATGHRGGDTGVAHQASAVLHVSQPALSRSTSPRWRPGSAPRCSSAPGPAWFRRRTGELLLRHAAAILQHLEAAEEALYSSGTRERRVLKVGTECYTGYHWLPGVSNRFAQAHPAVEIEIAFDAAGDPLPLLRKGAIDVALLTEHRPHRGIAVTKLFVDELVAAVSPRHAWASRPFLTPKDFSSVRLLLLSSPETRLRREQVPGAGGALFHSRSPMCSS